MKYEALGKTDMKVSRITFGCRELGGGPWEFTSDETNIRALQRLSSTSAKVLESQ